MQCAEDYEMMLDPTQDTEDEDAMYEDMHNDHMRELSTRAQAQNDAVSDATNEAVRVCAEKAGRQLTPDEARTIVARALIGKLYAESRRCVICYSAIERPEEAMATGRYIKDAEQTLYELIHLPSVQDRGKTCFSRARRARVYSTVVVYASMPALLPVREIDREAVEIGWAA